MTRTQIPVPIGSENRRLHSRCADHAYDGSVTSRGNVNKVDSSRTSIRPRIDGGSHRRALRPHRMPAEESSNVSSNLGQSIAPPSTTASSGVYRHPNARRSQSNRSVAFSGADTVVSTEIGRSRIKTSTDGRGNPYIRATASRVQAAMSDVTSVCTKMGEGSLARLWLTFDWAQLAAIAMNVHRDEVADTRNNVFRSFDRFDQRLWDIVSSYSTLRAEIDLYGTSSSREIFGNFDKKLVDFLQDWEERRL